MEPRSFSLRRFAQRLGANFSDVFDLDLSGVLMFYGAVVGLVAGLGASLFVTLLNLFSTLVLGGVVGYRDPSTQAANMQNILHEMTHRV